VLISGVRVRLTGEPGGIEVVVRAEATSACSVRLALRRVNGEPVAAPEIPDHRDDDLMEVWERWLELQLTESEAGGSCEAAHRFLLEPGSLWQVGAVGVGEEGLTGNAVCIQLRAPTELEMAQLPHSGSKGTGPEADPLSPTADESEEAEEDEEEEEEEVWVEADAPRVDGAVDGEPEVWTVRRASWKEAQEHVASTESSEEAKAEAGAEADASAVDDNNIGVVEANTEGTKVEAKTPPSAKTSPSAKAKAKCRVMADGPEVRRRCYYGKDPNRRLLRGPEVHKVISYQGQAAAEYARKIEENQRVWTERFPHRFEASREGGPRSVPVTFSLVVKENGMQGSASLERHHVPAEVLDEGRQAQQRSRDREDERACAAWIHSVTGDAIAKTAAKGECPLLDALLSGESLCDLVNAVWPGRILGICRGDLKPGKRLANITRFLQACGELGVGETFTPADLSEGKNPRRVVRCIFALAAIVPEAPEWEGTRLEDTWQFATPVRDSECQRSAPGAEQA